MPETIVKLTGSGNWSVPEGVDTLSDVLIVAGGGGGGRAGSSGAGGGAGGVIHLTDVDVSSLSEIAYSVGAGGVGRTGSTGPGEKGEDTTFGSDTAEGGGFGGAGNGSIDGGDGGSGGGAGNDTDPGSGTVGQGNDGGEGNRSGSNPDQSSGGGGGAGSVGGQGDSDKGGDGGTGVDFSAIFGDEYGDAGWFAGGGGGGHRISGAGGDGGIGGGGDGGGETSGSPTPGVTETGGGGGGGEGENVGIDSDGKDGGSGVILIRYDTGSDNYDLIASADSPLADASVVCDVPLLAYSSADSPLGDAAALGTVQINITATADSPLGDAFVLAESPLLAYASADSPLGDATAVGFVPAAVIARADSPLGPSRAYLINDWTATVPIDSQIYYVAELQHEGESVRMSISSWQATIQAGRSSFLQAVVPGAGSIIDDIAALADGDLVIYRGARRLDGTTSELEMARVPLGQMPANRGPGRLSVTLSGYGQIEFQEMGEAEGNKRTLTGVRSLSTQGGTRARTDIDWLLRPGMTALAAGEEFNVSYINYYVNVGQAFMDVGERAL